MTLPSEVQRVINARADDAIQGIFQAYDDQNRESLAEWVQELVLVIFDEESLQREFTP